MIKILRKFMKIRNFIYWILALFIPTSMAFVFLTLLPLFFPGCFLRTALIISLLSIICIPVLLWAAKWKLKKYIIPVIITIILLIPVIPKLLFFFTWWIKGFAP